MKPLNTELLYIRKLVFFR